MLKRLSVVAWLLGLASMQAQSAGVPRFADGDKLYGWLTSKNPIEVSMADGYILGVSDEITFWHSEVSNDKHTKGLCLNVPAGVTGTQMHDTVKNFLEQNPAIRQLNASAQVHLALQFAWPCKK